MSPAVSGSRQLMLDFQPGLTELYESALECVNGRVRSLGRPLKCVAADMDMSLSELSRKLADNPNDTRTFSLHDLETYVRATGDTTPILYLVQKFCADSQMRQREALGALAGMVPQLQALLKAAGVHGGEA